MSYALASIQSNQSPYKILRQTHREDNVRIHGEGNRTAKQLMLQGKSRYLWALLLPGFWTWWARCLPRLQSFFLANTINWEDLPSAHHLVVPKIKMATPH